MSVLKNLKSKPLRANFELNGVPFEGVWEPARGRYDVMLSKKNLKLAEAKLGDDVQFYFELANEAAKRAETKPKRTVQVKRILVSKELF